MLCLAIVARVASVYRL